MLSETSGPRLLKAELGCVCIAADKVSYQFTGTENPSGSPVVRYKQILRAACLKAKKFKFFLALNTSRSFKQSSEILLTYTKCIENTVEKICLLILRHRRVK